MENKKEKQLQKALKLAGIDKEKFDQVIDLLSDDEEEQTPQQEPAKEVKEEPKAEEVKKVEQEVVEPKKEEPQIDKYQEQINKLLEGMEKLSAQNKSLTEKIEKSQSFGYSPQQGQPSEEEVDDIIAKAKNFR